MSSTKPSFTLYTLHKIEIGEKRIYKGYVPIINSKGAWASCVEINVVADFKNGRCYGETKNSIYELVQVDKLPEWAGGYDRYLPLPTDVSINRDCYGSWELSAKSFGEPVKGTIFKETDDWWEILVGNGDARRYLKQA